MGPPPPPRPESSATRTERGAARRAAAAAVPDEQRLEALARRAEAQLSSLDHEYRALVSQMRAERALRETAANW